MDGDFINNVDRERGRRRITPTDTPLDQNPLKPVASEVDTYARAAAATKSPLWDVATALSGLSGDLDSYISKRKKETDDEERAAGAAAYHKNRQTAYGDAVRQGLIPPFASKAFIEAYKGQEGDVAGRQLATTMQAEYNQSGIGSSGDPAAGGKFVAERTAAMLQREKDPTVLASMLPRIRAAQDGIETAHRQATSETYFTRVNQNFQLQVNGILDDAMTSNEPVESTMGKIEGLKERLTAAGVPAARLDDITTKAIAQKAENTSNDGLLKVYDAPLRDGTTLGARLDVQTLRKSTGETIARKLLHDEDMAHKREERARKDLESKTTTQVVEMLRADPNATIPKELVDAGQKADPKFALTVSSLRKSFFEAKSVVDPERENGALVRIWDAGRQGGNPYEAFRREIDSGSLRSPQTIMKVWDDVMKMDGTQHSREADILKTGAAGEAMKVFEQTLTPPTPAMLRGMEASGAGKPGYVAHPNYLEMRRAQMDYQNTLLRWRRENPNASLADMEQKAHDTFLQVGGYIVDDKGQRWRPGDRMQDGKLHYKMQGTPEPILRDTPARPTAPSPGGPPYTSQSGSVNRLIERTIGAESQGNASAHNTTGGADAMGAGQFIPATWAALIAKHRPDIAQGRSAAELRNDSVVMGMRKDAGLSRQMIGKLHEENATALLSQGVPITDANLYMAYFAGPKAAVRLIEAAPEADAASIMAATSGISRDVLLKQNPFLAGKTAGWLNKWAARKIGGGGEPTGTTAPVGLPKGWTAQDAERATGVHSDLMRIVKRASEISAVPFSVGADGGGTRTQEKQAELVRRGASKTMHSHHLAGVGTAIDLWPNGNPNASPEDYAKVSAAMKQAAAELGLPMQWGGDWKGFVDKPHYQLPRGWEKRAGGGTAVASSPTAKPVAATIPAQSAPAAEAPKVTGQALADVNPAPATAATPTTVAAQPAAATIAAPPMTFAALRQMVDSQLQSPTISNADKARIGESMVAFTRTYADEAARTKEPAALMAATLARLDRTAPEVAKLLRALGDPMTKNT